MFILVKEILSIFLHFICVFPVSHYTENTIDFGGAQGSEVRALGPTQ